TAARAGPAWLILGLTAIVAGAADGEMDVPPSEARIRYVPEALNPWVNEPPAPVKPDRIMPVVSRIDTGACALTIRHAATSPSTTGECSGVTFWSFTAPGQRRSVAE